MHQRSIKNEMNRIILTPNCVCRFVGSAANTTVNQLMQMRSVNRNAVISERGTARWRETPNELRKN